MPKIMANDALRPDERPSNTPRNELQIPREVGLAPASAQAGTGDRFLSPQPRSPHSPSPSSSSFGGETLREDAYRARADSTLTDRSDVTLLKADQASLWRSRSMSQSSNHGGGGSDGVVEVSRDEALRPEPRYLSEFQAENNPFGFTPGLMNKMQNPKSLAAYRALGGIYGIEKGLRTSLTAGLSVEETTFSDSISFVDAVNVDMHQSPQRSDQMYTIYPNSKESAESGTRFMDRKRIFKDNTIPDKKAIPFWKLLQMAYNDKVLIILTIAAVISLALGLYETLGTPHEAGEGAKIDWVEGVAIVVAIVIVVVVTALNDWQKERQFVRLNKKKEDREVKAIRSGKSVKISVHDVMVGDVLHLEPGDLIPADGIFISGHNLKCDESSATGESDQMDKTAGEEVSRYIADGVGTCTLDPFIISGAKVLEGIGTYVVTSVGVYSSFGKIMMGVRQETEPTPLQVKLFGLASAIAKLGSGAALFLFAVLFIRFLATLPNSTLTPALKASRFLDILIVAVTIIVVAVPEGLPLAVTLALAFATTRMLKENNLVRVLRACETMGNATTVCSDKTGTLTQNQMTVVAGTIGLDTQFTQSDETRQELQEKQIDNTSTAVSKISPESKKLLVQSIVINSTAFEGESEGVQTYIGSKTETALLTFARDFLGMAPVAEERSNVTTEQFFPFDSDRKCMGVVLKLPGGGIRFLVKGASEILLAKTKQVLQVSAEGSLKSSPITSKQRQQLESTITHYAERSLRTIAMVYKDLEKWPHEADGHPAPFDRAFFDMNLIGIMGIQDPLRPGVSAAVKKCQDAGVVVRMVTGDNITTATAIATECGIKTPEGRVLEGPEFRRLSNEELDEVIPHLQVLARSSPDDKRVLVERLKFLGETVAVTGDGTNDAPALKLSDVGFSMGIAGTEVAKEASEIILMDDNFSSIVKALMWGRAVNDAVSKFLQFQITVNITAVLLAFVSAVASSQMKSVLTAVQLLWVNLIMDTFAALALATDAPTDKILDRKPAPKSAPLITINMWKMILGQAVYQLVITFILYFAGPRILGYNYATEPWRENQLRTMVFNTFVWMQIFNEFNNRRLDNKFNIFEGVHRNWFFIIINTIMVGGQVMIIFVGGQAFQVVRISGVQWAICIGLAIFCLPWAIVLRLIPDRYAEVFFKFVVRHCAFVLRPIRNAFRQIWAQFARPFRALFRVMRRKTSRNQRASEDSQTAASDEEAAAAPGAKSEKSKKSEFKAQALSPPPITVTSS